MRPTRAANPARTPRGRLGHHRRAPPPPIVVAFPTPKAPSANRSTCCAVLDDVGGGCWGAVGGVSRAEPCWGEVAVAEVAVAVKGGGAGGTGGVLASSR